MIRGEIIREFIENLGKVNRLVFKSCMVKMSMKNLPTRAQFGILMMLGQGEKFGIKEIAAHFGISSSAATQIVDGLVESKLILRKADKEDRRKIILTITTTGKKKLEQAKKIRLESAAELFQTIKTSDLQELNSSQKKILSSLSEGTK